MSNLMNSSVPLSAEDRRKFLQAFYDLPDIDRKNFQEAWYHLRCLMVLWQLEDLASDRALTLEEKRHTLLAYKSLQMLWFDELPALVRQPFTIHLRDELPKDKLPDVIVQTFKTSLAELSARTREQKRPRWLGRKSEAVIISIQSFPYKVAQ